MKPPYIICNLAKYDSAVSPEHFIGDVNVQFSSQLLANFNRNDWCNEFEPRDGDRFQGCDSCLPHDERTVDLVVLVYHSKLTGLAVALETCIREVVEFSFL